MKGAVAIMTNETNPSDLAERVKLIEDMLQEGRRTTGRWGWTFVLWGVAYLVATFWGTSGVAGGGLAWPVCMVGATILTFWISAQMSRGKPGNPRSRGLTGIWISVGSALFLFAFGSSLSPHRSVAITLGGIEILLGVANAASSLTLRWKTQFAVALLWWAAGMSTFFVGEKAMGIIFLAATFLCQIVFGIYLMFLESAERKRELAHA